MCNKTLQFSFLQLQQIILLCIRKNQYIGMMLVNYVATAQIYCIVGEFKSLYFLVVLEVYNNNL